MDDREYLRSLGFTVGDRGRFSKEMKAALANRDGVDPDAPEPEYGAQDRFADGRYRIERSNGLPSLARQVTVMRNAKAYMVTLTSGQKIACGNCHTCKDHVMYCECEDGPHPPDYLDAEDIASWSAVV